MTELDAQSRLTDQAATTEEPEPPDESRPGSWGETESTPPAPTQPDATDLILEAFEAEEPQPRSPKPRSPRPRPTRPDWPRPRPRRPPLPKSRPTPPSCAAADLERPPVAARHRGRSAGSSPTPSVPPAFATPSRSRASRSSGLLDAFEDAGIRVIATRHEGAASFMAEAHGQLTGRPAVCLGTRAVGGSNLAIGIHTARQDSTPMFAVVGQVERSLLGREAFQEIDQVATIGGLAKWAAEPHTADEITAAVRRGRSPGPRRPAGPGPPGAPRGPPRRADAGRHPGRRRPRSSLPRAIGRGDPRRDRVARLRPDARSSWPGPASCAPGPRRN